QKGEYVGTGVSTGNVRGRIKILHTADEKPLLKGEILVARATDPGWTPLFVNAGGIILEVGGSLQHGALVAREYGIPCVAGVDSRHPVTSFVVGVLIGVDNCRNVFCWSAKNYEVGATKFRRSHNHCDLLGIYSSVHRAHSFLI